MNLNKFSGNCIILEKLNGQKIDIKLKIIEE
jgi:hypothetical protein